MRLRPGYRYRSVVTWILIGLAVALAIELVAGRPARAQTPSADTLLAKLFGSEEKTPYELSADFTGLLVLSIRGGRLLVVAEGSFLEWRGADGVRRRKVTVNKLDLPLLLRPFSGAVRRVIEEKIETQAETPETFHAHEMFVFTELPSRRYVLVGVHRSIVDEAIDRYGQPQDKKDPIVRRKIAQWLFTSPTMSEFLVRPGPPYALRVIVDEAGQLYELALFYDWGEVSTRISYTLLNGTPVWRQITADTVSELAGVGRVDGQLVLNFFNHCANCLRP